MKVIINSEHLKRIIGSIPFEDARIFEIKKDEIHFASDWPFESSHKHYITCDGGEYQGSLRKAQWMKMKAFLDMLPEQPITLEFTEYMHTKLHQNPEITIYGYAISF